jgi:hypothetical protein
MIHIYEIESHGINWEVYKQHPYESWQDQFIRTLENHNELDLYLDICREMGVDFILHTLEEYDEYHLAVSSV